MKKYFLLLMVPIVLTACGNTVKRDEFGCAVGSEFTWHADVSACARSVDVATADLKTAVTAAVQEVKFKKPTTVIAVRSGCPDCFSVEIERRGKRFEVNLKGGVVTEMVRQKN